MLLEIQGLESHYGRVKALKGVDISVKSGELVALVGANGAGKTTLVRTVCGLLRARGGQIVKNGTDITATPAHDLSKHGLAVVLENRRLFGELSVRENLILAETVGRQVRGADLRFSWDEVTALFPVVKERLASPVELLSGGQQQMVAIARALLLQPDLLIMDEPSTGLAPKVVKDILLVSHDMGLMTVARTVHTLYFGEIIASGDMAAIQRDPRVREVYLGV